MFSPSLQCGTQHLSFLFLLSILPCILAVQVHPVARGISSDATCTTDNSHAWMDDAQGNSPCLTVAYVEAACIGNSYIQPALNVGYAYSLPNSTTESPCYCSWSSYNLMMACTLCQAPNFNSSLWTWPVWSSGCTANSSWTAEYFPSGYVLSEGMSIPSWAAFNPANWTSETFNVTDAQEVYQQYPSDIVPGTSSTLFSTSSSTASSTTSSTTSSTASSTSSSTSSSSSSSKSTDAGAISGGTVGAAAAIALLVICAYLLYRRRVYNNAYASIARSNGATTRMTRSRFGSETSTYFALGQPMSPSQQYTVYSPQSQTLYPFFQGSFSPPRTDMSIFHTAHGVQTSNAIPLV
ncbi:hypothetical protein K503DRAFT_541162 [Rhizopogon vinicolor AM-OR11-026]|uniref:Uncharacterized protein n=1 Tax=Rhizopogon vinicolor AM-OR11-026 TaxID=1314800 RepID=A0A1B7MKU2_9AGAM|nr:hypothetical protein K503DRAFT_541162 [Rhizopogon vinicolor AM-OR11-026]